MTDTITFRGRLPGAICSPALPAAAEQPLRLDVAAFVGFAERGPLDEPIPVEDVNQYRVVFGGDLVLAQDDDRPVYAHLPEAVAAFFENGGRRAYVVRVAGDARSARLTVPGLRAWPGASGADEAVVVEAAWPGRWADRLRVGTQLLSQPLAVAGPFDRTGMRIPLDATASRVVQGGDLLRVDTPAGMADLFLAVVGVAAAPLVQGDEDRAVGPPYARISAAVPFTFGSPPGDEVELLSPMALADMPDTVPVEALTLLRFDLLVLEDRDEGPELEQWSDLRFGLGGLGVPEPATGRVAQTVEMRPWWGDVLQPADGPRVPAAGRSYRLRGTSSDDRSVHVPVGMGSSDPRASVTATDGGNGTGPGDGSLPGDDGLAVFDPVAFYVDPNLSGFGTASLLAQADALTVLSPDPIRLRGIHSLVGIDEVALIAVPDAAHRPWGPSPRPAAAPDPEPVRAEAPDWTNFRDCALAPPAVAPSPIPPRGELVDKPVLDPPATYDATGLLAVQQAVAELCAARADAVGVLSLPGHFTRTDTLDWTERFAALPRMGDGACLSYAAVWHPWPSLLEERTPELAPLRPTPPDGAACGIIATRENQRGVWLAPANIALRGPLDLSPQLAPSDWPALFDAHINLLRHQPGAFNTLSAHTLSRDRLLLQISVRRLLILIRKLALERGHRYMFEPNTERFRRQVRSTFERLLSRMAAQGALTAYAVETGEGLNTSNDIDNGRVVVAIKIAPTSPVEFITVTLVRDREGILDVVER